MMDNPITLKVYNRDDFPDYRIEKWESGMWAVMKVSNETLCSTRKTLREAKELFRYWAGPVCSD
jgi:hypothetical protein